MDLYNMDKSEKHVQTQKCATVYFYWYKIQEQAELSYGDRNQKLPRVTEIRGYLEG